MLKIKDIPDGAILWKGDTVIGVKGMSLPEFFDEYTCTKIHGNDFDYELEEQEFSQEALDFIADAEIDWDADFEDADEDELWDTFKDNSENETREIADPFGGFNWPEIDELPSSDDPDYDEMAKAYEEEQAEDTTPADWDEPNRFPKNEDLDIKEAVKRLEENEDNVECKHCFDLFPKADCIKTDDGYICKKCDQEIHSHQGTNLDLIDADPFDLNYDDPRDEEEEPEEEIKSEPFDADENRKHEEGIQEAAEELQDVNYVDYKHSYCHILQPNLKKLNAIVHYYKEPLSTVKGFIFNLLKDPSVIWTSKERKFADNIRKMDNSEDIYNYVVNSIEKAKTIIVKVKPNGELASMQDADLEEAAPVEFSEEELKLDEKLYSYLTDPSGFEGEVEAADEDEAFRKAETEVAQKGAYVADELIDIKEVEESLEEHINDRPADIESDQELQGTDNAVVDCEVAKVIAHSEDEKPVDCKMEKPALEEPVAGKPVDAELYEAKKDDEEELPPDPGAVKVEVHGMLNDLVADEIEAINGYEDVKAELVDEPIEHKDEIIATLDHIKDEEKEHIDELVDAASEIPFDGEHKEEAPAPVVEEPAPVIEEEPVIEEKYQPKNALVRPQDGNIRVADVEYEDDDGYNQHVLVYAGFYDEEDLMEKLYDDGFMYVSINDIYEVPAEKYIPNIKTKGIPFGAGEIFEILDEALNKDPFDQKFPEVEEDLDEAKSDQYTVLDRPTYFDDLVAIDTFDTLDAAEDCVEQNCKNSFWWRIMQGNKIVKEPKELTEAILQEGKGDTIDKVFGQQGYKLQHKTDKISTFNTVEGKNFARINDAIEEAKKLSKVEGEQLVKVVSGNQEFITAEKGKVLTDKTNHIDSIINGIKTGAISAATIGNNNSGANNNGQTNEPDALSQKQAKREEEIKNYLDDLNEGDIKFDPSTFDADNVKLKAYLERAKKYNFKAAEGKLQAELDKREKTAAAPQEQELADKAKAAEAEKAETALKDVIIKAIIKKFKDSSNVGGNKNSGKYTNVIGGLLKVTKVDVAKQIIEGILKDAKASGKVLFSKNANTDGYHTFIIADLKAIDPDSLDDLEADETPNVEEAPAVEGTPANEENTLKLADVEAALKNTYPKPEQEMSVRNTMAMLKKAKALPESVDPFDQEFPKNEGQALEEVAAKIPFDSEVSIGDRIRIIHLAGESTEYDGREGEVSHIDDLGQLHGTWGGLAVIPGMDEFEVITDESLKEETIYGLYINKEEKPAEVGSHAEMTTKKKHLEDTSPDNKYVVKKIGNSSWESLEEALPDWDSRVNEADRLLDELCGQLNIGADDGDGYWYSEYDTWCNRNLYYVGAFDPEDKELLDKLIPEYNKKLAGCEFYVDEDEDEEVSEVGYWLDRHPAEEAEDDEDMVECSWCGEKFPKSECRYEKDFEWLCPQCEAALKSRGEELDFIEPAPEE